MKPENNQEQSDRERREEPSDLLDLRDAVQRNADQPLIPWAKVKKDLELE